jgi:voltage-gated sodium channel
VYSLSWIFYLTFIFFTAFAFLNMVIGIVVNVMERENEKAREEKAAALKAEQVAKGTAEPTLSEVMAELQSIKAALADKHK